MPTLQTLPQPKPIISVHEARKLLGASAKRLTNEELGEVLLRQEQIIRAIVRQYRVHKSTVVK